MQREQIQFFLRREREMMFAYAMMRVLRATGTHISIGLREWREKTSSMRENNTEKFFFASKKYSQKILPQLNRLIAQREERHRVDDVFPLFFLLVSSTLHNNIDLLVFTYFSSVVNGHIWFLAHNQLSRDRSGGLAARQGEGDLTTSQRGRGDNCPMTTTQSECCVLI